MDPREPTPPRRKRVRRLEHSHHLRFLTFSTHEQLPLFMNARIRDHFALHLDQARKKFSFNLYAWVIMPEHVHILIWPLIPEFPVSSVTREMKRRFAREVIARWRTLHAPILLRLTLPNGKSRSWLPGGGYDRNTFSPEEIKEKVTYTHPTK